MWGQDRLAYGQVHGIAPDRKGTQGTMAAALPRLFRAPSGGAARRRRRGGRGADGDGDGVDDAQDNEEVYAGNRCACSLGLTTLLQRMTISTPATSLRIPRDGRAYFQISVMCWRGAVALNAPG